MFCFWNLDAVGMKESLRNPDRGRWGRWSAIPAVVAAGMRDPQIEFPTAGFELLGLEAVCVALTAW